MEEDQKNNLIEYIYKIDRPCLFKGIIQQSESDQVKNSICNWTPDYLRNLFKDAKLTFRIGKKNLSNKSRPIVII